MAILHYNHSCVFNSLTEFNFPCGAMLTERVGSFQPADNNNDEQYDNRLRCYWVIPSTSTYKTYLTFRRMDIEWHELCAFDYLRVI